MPTYILSHHLDIASFAAVVLAASVTVHLYLRRATGAGGLNARAWLILLLLVVAGGGFAVVAGEHERDRLRAQVEGFAPTYALEMQEAGHARLSFQTPPDDPRYLTMIETQKRWLAVNPAVNDIYTFRATPDGGVALLVDSETDYDHDGKYEGEREARTPIGERVTTDATRWKLALAGQAVFDGEPYEDRWGTWVSAYVPIRDVAGRVEGGLGVDFDARAWARAILASRGGVLAFAAVAVVILVWSGRIISMAGHEVRQRRAAEASVRASEARLRAIVDNEPEAVLVTTADGTILEVNPSGAATLGVPAGAAADRPDPPRATVLQFVAPDHAAAAAAWFGTVAGGRPGRMTLPVVGPGGGQRWLDAHAVPLPAPAGAPAGTGPAAAVLVVARDVTLQRTIEAEREHLQQQLVAASREAGMAEIANGVIHNVGNVLNTVNLATHAVAERLRRSRVSGLAKAVALLDEHKDDLPRFLGTDDRGRQLPDYLRKVAVNLGEEQERMLSELRDVCDGVDHLKAIVNAQQTHAGRKAVEEPLRPAAVMEDAVKMNVASCDRHAVRIDHQFEDLPPVPIDKHKAIQVLVNLISNAKNAVTAFNPPEKRIVLRVRGAGTDAAPTVRFEVADNGHGIPPDVMPKVFTMGFTTRKDGHGFGLHAAANLAKEMGGTLTAASPGAGAGATFVLEVPARRGPARRAA